MPQVSVIIPLYNKANCVLRALTSVLNQSHQDFELIVVDDGSTDESVSVVRKIADSRLRLISQANQGPGAARNRGAIESSGEYLAFLDADDEWMPDFLRKSLAALDQAPDCGFCISAFLDGPERQNSHTRLESRGYGPGRYEVRPDTRPDSFDWLLHAYLPSTAVFRRDMFKACGGFYHKNRCLFGEDMYLFVTASMRHPFWRLAEPLVWYHSEDSSLATQKNVLTPLLLDPQPMFDLCPERNKPVLRGFLADRAVQESLKQAYGGSFTTWRQLFDRFDCVRVAGKRARNGRRQILALGLVAGSIGNPGNSIIRRILHRIFPMSVNSIKKNSG